MTSQFYIAAVIKAIDSSKSLFPAASADADRCNASPTPTELIAKLLPQVIAYIFVTVFILK